MPAPSPAGKSTQPLPGEQIAPPLSAEQTAPPELPTDAEQPAPLLAPPDGSKLSEAPEGAAPFPAAVSFGGCRVVLDTLLGRGGFGLVFSATQAGQSTPVAAKMFATRRNDEDRVRRAMDTALSIGHHPNLVALYHVASVDEGEGRALLLKHGSVWIPEPGEGVYCWCTMEKADHELISVLAGQREVGIRTPPSSAFTWVHQAASGLQFLHANGLCHTDMKAENLLLVRQPEGKLVCKLADVDSVHQTGEPCATATMAYLDPMLCNECSPPATPSRDMWAFGVTAHYVLTQGLLPAGMVQAFEAAERGEHAPLRALRDGPKWYGLLLKGCWYKAAERWSMADFLQGFKPRKFIDLFKKQEHAGEKQKYDAVGKCTDPAEANGGVLDYLAERKRRVGNGAPVHS
eukprot:TRINITY_DN11476_c0_g1_i9.p1 TRINITY_DN11476_c0_g1~~TRINITY_DN11476_c0_g1_i9.p1  ORF type:complete len:435 (+),score=85.03 TRINITY_DN11476_c0_g1_i9:99-1307(+)